MVSIISIFLWFFLFCLVDYNAGVVVVVGAFVLKEVRHQGDWRYLKAGKYDMFRKITYCRQSL
jgi:hypothetical protein